MDGFHTHNGWFWKREPDGSVQITVLRSDGETIHAAHTLPPSEWASVVASVSARNEDGDTYREALDFHGKTRQEVRP